MTSSPSALAALFSYLWGFIHSVDAMPHHDISSLLLLVTIGPHRALDFYPKPQTPQSPYWPIIPQWTTILLFFFHTFSLPFVLHRNLALLRRISD